MSHNVKNRRESAALLLACGSSVRKAAQCVRVNERTVHRWLEDDTFRHRISELRTSMFDRAVGRLSKISGKATGVLAQLLNSNDERIQLAAAKTILDVGVKAREFAEQSKRLDELERQIYNKVTS